MGLGIQNSKMGNWLINRKIKGSNKNIFGDVGINNTKDFNKCLKE